MQARLEGLERRDLVTAENAAAVGARDELVEARCVVHELAQHGERELGIGEAPPALEIGRRQALGHVQPAIGREAFQKDVAKALRPAAAAGADVAHVLPLRLALRAELAEPADLLGRGLLMGSRQGAHSSSSMRRRTIWPATVSRRSMRAVACSTWRSSARCVSMTISTWLSPSPGSFCTIATIEILQSARTRVMSASTPGRSSTRMRR